MNQSLTTSFPPTIGDSYSNGWKQLWKKFLELFLIGIVMFLFTLPAAIPSWIMQYRGYSGDNWDMDPFAMMGPSFWSYFLFAIAYGVLFLSPLQYGVNYAYLKASRNEKLEIRDMFSFTANYVNVVLANLLVGFIVGIGIVFLILPGIIFACKLAFVPYLVIDKKMEVIEALKESWKRTDGHAIDIFVMGLLAVPIFLLGLVFLVIGTIPAIMWISTAFASMYHAVDLSYKPTVDSTQIS